MKNKNLVTMYTSGGFGVSKEVVDLQSMEVKPYAQFDKALWLTFVPKGKRKPQRMIIYGDKFFMMFAGEGHPEPPAKFITQSSSVPGIVCQSSKYACFDDRYITDFTDEIDHYLAISHFIPLIDSRKSIEPQYITPVATARI